VSIRAVRNNNPGNIVADGDKWQGLTPRGMMTPEQAAEAHFCVFATPAYGFRALAKIFITYNRVDRVDTLRQAIKRFAPPSENDTDAYIRAVCNYTGNGPDDHFGFRSAPNLQALCKAVAIHECGGWFFSQSDLAEGVSRALAG